MNMTIAGNNLLAGTGPGEKEEARGVSLRMDEETFRAFYDRTARSVWAYLARVTGDRQLADDLLQETYYRFFRAGGSFESEAHRRNSLFCIASNLAVDTVRRGRGKHHVSLSDDPEIPAARVEGPGSSEWRSDLQRAMQQLSPAQREMLWLAYAEGSSHAEIASVVGVKTASVKQLLFRARKKAAALLRGSE